MAQRGGGLIGRLAGFLRGRRAEADQAPVYVPPTDGPTFAEASHPLQYGHPPAWASAWGEDEFGVWTSFTIGEATQTLRWIGPGSFRMGSPDHEPGRYGPADFGGQYNEGPQHQVTLTEGFWLFDTPVTQALWQAVMDDNPSRFVSPDRPVERVSWDDIQVFLERINHRIDGLDLVLPTEAQWEYACRAGVAEATYAGAIEILGERNAPVLDAIAWYGGNSGIGFELDKGHDSSGWPDKQYEHSRAGTHPVARKVPNPWGLYDMLGNVWEWCADGLRPYDGDPKTDPAGPQGSPEGSSSRALRGGAWFFLARSVRAADRYARSPGARDDDIGFRCARVRP